MSKTTYHFYPSSRLFRVERGARSSRMMAITPHCLAFALVADALEVDQPPKSLCDEFFKECVEPKLDQAAIEFEIDGVRNWLASQREKQEAEKAGKQVEQ